MTLASGRASYRKKTSERQAKKEKREKDALKTNKPIAAVIQHV